MMYFPQENFLFFQRSLELLLGCLSICNLGLKILVRTLELCSPLLNPQLKLIVGSSELLFCVLPLSYIPEYQDRPLYDAPVILDGRDAVWIGLWMLFLEIVSDLPGGKAPPSNVLM
jgi:hypothetical protein